jgi:hypothetical protein
MESLKALMEALPSVVVADLVELVELGSPEVLAATPDPDMFGLRPLPAELTAMELQLAAMEITQVIMGQPIHFQPA